MRKSQTLAILMLAGSALLVTGASAQQTSPQGSPPASGQAMPCPPGGPMGPGHGMGPGPGMRGGMGPGAGPAMGPGQMGGMMGMTPEERQQMHQEMLALREEMRLLREELRKAR